MKNYWQLREDLTAAQRKYLSREYDVKGFSPEEERAFLKVTKGKRDANGVPDFTGVTLCDIVSLNVDDFGLVLDTAGGGNWSARGDEFTYSDYKIRGWYPFTGIAHRIYDALDKAFGDALMGAGKSSVIDIFRQMKSCPNRGDWARYEGGTLYRGKRISWKQFSRMPWKIVNGQLQCTSTYQSKLAMQSWTIDPKVAYDFAAGHEGAMSGKDLRMDEFWDDDTGDFIRYSRDIVGFLPTVIQAVVPAKDCFLNPVLLDRLQRKLGHGLLKEKEVLRISTAPIRAQFTVTKKMLRMVTNNDDEVDHIFNLVLKRK